jgi:hypothetical protein
MLGLDVSITIPGPKRMVSDIIIFLSESGLRLFFFPFLSLPPSLYILTRFLCASAWAFLELTEMHLPLSPEYWSSVPLYPGFAHGSEYHKVKRKSK